METFFVVVALLLGGILVLLLAVRPPRNTTSHFELQRRATLGEHHAQTILHHDILRHEVMGLLRIVSWLVLVWFVLALIGGLGWLWGSGVAIIFVVCSAFMARLKIVRTMSKRMYARYEPRLFAFLERFPHVVSFVHESPPVSPHEKLESREHLLHLVNHSQGVLTDAEKTLIRGSAGFYDVEVGQIMTPIDEVVTIAGDELLGPLVLDDLHKTGHHFFPVTAGKRQTIVGMLELDTLLSVHARHTSTTAKKSMNESITYTYDGDSAYDALMLFLQARQHVLVVQNQSGNPCGLVTLGDVMTVLFGNTPRGGVE